MNDFLWFCLGFLSASLLGGLLYLNELERRQLANTMKRIAEDDAEFWREQCAQYKRIATSYVFPSPAKPKAERLN